MSPLVRQVADGVIAKTERMIRFAQRVSANYADVPNADPRGLSSGVRDALTLARDVLMIRCHCRIAARGQALDAINRELKAAGYVWKQTSTGPVLVPKTPRPLGVE